MLSIKISIIIIIIIAFFIILLILWRMQVDYNDNDNALIDTFLPRPLPGNLEPLQWTGRRTEHYLPLQVSSLSATMMMLNEWLKMILKTLSSFTSKSMLNNATLHNYWWKWESYENFKLIMTHLWWWILNDNYDD